MIKLLVFDMDGVLVDAKELHYQALNQALVDAGLPAITRDEQATIYEALPTARKLQIYSEHHALPVERHAEINRAKQRITLEMTARLLRPDPLKIEMLRRLQNEGYRIFCASNSIPETISAMLKAVGLYDFIEVRLSNKDVENCKPHPEIYHKAMSIAGVDPAETMIVEDSLVGRLAAAHSGGRLCEVADPAEVTYERIMGQIRLLDGKAAPLPPLQVLIPMAGAGSRFAQAGYTFPKPLIAVGNKPMIQVAVENLGATGKHIFVVQREHCSRFALPYMLPLISPGCEIVRIDGVTQGAACTTLLAREKLDGNLPLLIANSDQFVDWDAADFYRQMAHSDADGAILTFRSTHPKWSYVRPGPDGFVQEVAEKRPISNVATVGVYYWRRACDYLHYADQMISADERVNGEFYVAPVYNRAIQAGKKIVMYDVHRMWSLGTPEDLQQFLAERT